VQRCRVGAGAQHCISLLPQFGGERLPPLGAFAFVAGALRGVLELAGRRGGDQCLHGVRVVLEVGQPNPIDDEGSQRRGVGNYVQKRLGAEVAPEEIDGEPKHDGGFVEALRFLRVVLHDALAHTFSVYPSLSGSITEAGRQLMRHDDLD